jgi:hypothetical protein
MGWSALSEEEEEEEIKLAPQLISLHIIDFSASS